MLSDEFPQLPGDLWDLVRAHRAAMDIQRCVRRHLLRHAHHPLWTTLLRRLVPLVNSQELATLQGNRNVRHEWRTEPCSWIFTCERFPEAPMHIAEEVVAGLWKSSGTTKGVDLPTPRVLMSLLGAQIGCRPTAHEL